MGNQIKDMTGDKFPGGWEVIRLHAVGGGATMWLSRHKCGHEQALRADQLRSGRESLCRNCGKRTAKTDAARIASSMAARKPRAKAGPTLCEQIAETRKLANAIGGKTQTTVAGTAPKLRRKLTPAEIGLEQARAFSVNC